MRAPDQFEQPTMVVSVPWAHPQTGRRFATVLDAALATPATDRTAWFVLSDGRLLNPVQVSALRAACVQGTILEYRFEE
jgi:hypothetical protein